MRLTRSAARLLLTLTLVGVSLSGCGFQLRGATAVPDALDPVYVECTVGTPPDLCEQVSELLELNQVTVNATHEPDSYVLRIDDFRRSRRATAITTSASAAEYDLRLRSSISLYAPGNIPLLTGADIIANEVYRYDENNVLAQRREQQTLAEQLYQRLAQQIVYRLTPFTGARIEALRASYQQEQSQPEASPQLPGN